MNNYNLGWINVVLCCFTVLALIMVLDHFELNNNLNHNIKACVTIENEFNTCLISNNFTCSCYNKYESATYWFIGKDAPNICKNYTTIMNQLENNCQILRTSCYKKYGYMNCDDILRLKWCVSADVQTYYLEYYVIRLARNYSCNLLVF